MPLNIGEILRNRYRLDELIGRGGFGAVYRGYDLALKQFYAVKENLNTSAEAQRQFEREALILARLRHPNLPRVIDHFMLPGQGQYLVMDFVEGYSLAHLLKTQAQPLSEAQAMPWLDQVCQALIYLHSQKPPIIHRDIKPQNIIITPEGRAILVDFGLSKFYDEQFKTTTGAQGVTFGYAPPEQYGRGRTNVRSDIYALGATLYTMLTNQCPPDAIHRLVNNEPLIPPNQLGYPISLHVEQALLKAMALPTAERFESTETFRQALTTPATRPALPVKFQPVPPQKLSPYQVGGAALGSLLLTLLVSLAGLGYWAWRSETFSGPLSPIATPTLATAVVSILTPLPEIGEGSTTPIPPTPTFTSSSPIDTPTSAPSLTLTPTLLPTQPPPAKPGLQDDFTDQTLFFTQWESFPNSGTVQLVDGALALTGNSGNTFPYVRLRQNPFPAEGDFVLAVELQYPKAGTFGAGLVIGGVPPANDSPVQAAPDPKVEQFKVWQDTSYYKALMIGTLDKTMRSWPVPDTQRHQVQFVYLAGQVQVYVDGQLVGQEPERGGRPTTLWFGNPYRTPETGSWSELRVYSVSVEELKPTPVPPTLTPIPPTPTPTPGPPTETPTASPTPIPAYPFELAEVDKEIVEGFSQTLFQGMVTDAAGNSLNGVFVQASCGNYSTISYPTGPVAWGAEKSDGSDGASTWPPGYYDINLGQPQPCTWYLTVVDTDDRQTVKAKLSEPAILNVTGEEGIITVNWRRTW